MRLIPSISHSLRLSVGLAAWLFLAGLAHASPIPGQVVNFMNAYCAECHRPDKAEGDFSLTYLKPATTPEDAEYWQLVLDNLHLGDMPPRKAKQPTIEEVEPVTAWIEAELERARRVLAGHASEVVMRRLNVNEYQNVMLDLFGVQGDYAVAIPEDTKEEGFDNIGAALMLSAEHLTEYMKIADFVLGRAIREGEAPKLQEKTFTLRDIQDIEDQRAREREARKTGKKPEEIEIVHRGPYYPDYGDGQDALIPISGRLQPNTRSMFPVREPGYYEFSVTAYPVRNKGKIMPLQVRISNGNPSIPPEVIDTIQLQDPDEPVTRSFRVYIEPPYFVDVSMLGGARHIPGPEIPGSQEPMVAIREFQMKGPIHEQWPPRGHQLVLGELRPDELTDDLVPELLATVAPKLFRRPVAPNVLEEYQQYYQQQRAEKSPIEAYQSTLKAMMVSPFFLFQLEPAGQIDQYALASRLSFFLWRSVPDDTLYQLAAAGTLSEPQTLIAQVDRMLEDPKSERFIEDFVGQWLEVDKVGEMQPDGNLYPEYDAALEMAMVEETTRFIHEMIQHNLPIANLIDSDWTMLNDRLAEHYGIQGVKGNEFRRVKLDKSQTVRGGLLTHASILNVTSNGTTTSPVVRGVWMLDRLLGTPAPPPPPDVPPIEPDIRGATTIQEQLAAHRDIPQCASCHEKIDPFGLALENFDVIGGWRENYRALEGSGRRSKLVDGQPISADGELPRLGKFENFEQFRAILFENQHFVYTNMADKLATYALGRTLDFSDREQIESITRLTQQHGGGLRTMIHALIQSPLFQKP